MRHPNVVRLFGASFDSTPMVVMAYAPAGTLGDALAEGRFDGVASVVRLLAGIARGMEAVHTHSLVHLDLKPENVLIGPLDVPWITDFGLSTSTNLGSGSLSTAGGRGTLAFRAPETVNFDSPPVITPAADVYSFAILAWNVVTGETPFANLQYAEQTLPGLVRHGKRPELGDGSDWRDRTTRPLYTLIEVCWATDNTQRPAFGTWSSDLAGEGSRDDLHALGIVNRLERLEASYVKPFDESMQLPMVTHLLASTAGAEAAEAQIAQIDEAFHVATDAEARELAEERDGLETSRAIALADAARMQEQIAKLTGGNEMLVQMMAMVTELNAGMAALRAKVGSHDLSLANLAVGELDCPRLFVLLPLEATGRSSMQRLFQRAKGYVKDRYRLVFLDPITGMAVPTGPEGDGYRIEVPKKFLVEHRKQLNAGLKVVKLTASLGRTSGLPLPCASYLPSELVSKAEAEAVAALDTILDDATSLSESTSYWGRSGSSTRAPANAKGATGKAYKALRKLLDDQCHDKYLEHCSLAKARADDGAIEFVSAETRERFIREGQACLIWNHLEAAAADHAVVLEAEAAKKKLQDSPERAGAATATAAVGGWVGGLLGAAEGALQAMGTVDTTTEVVVLS